MCSELITMAGSCYVDNFYLIGSVYARAICWAMIIGTVVGILIQIVKTKNQ